MTDLIKIAFNNGNQIIAQANLWLLVAAIVALGIYIFFPWLFNILWRQEFEIDEIELGIGDNKIKIKPNNEDLQIAYKLWVELKTRKLGLPFEEDHDNIIEVYNSWYEFFKITRELIKSIPISKIRANKSTQQLVQISIDVLNKAVRPHLTKWQARFRWWHQSEVNKLESRSLSPQEIQKGFPDYKNLVEDLKKTNQYLVAYSEVLSKIIGADMEKIGIEQSVD